MARPLPGRELDSLMLIVRMHPEGVGIDQIEALLANPPNRRTVQRWLALLQGDGRIERAGKARAARYRVAKPSAGAVQQAPYFPDWLAANSETSPYRGKPLASRVDIDLSADADAIRAYLLQPLHQRAVAPYRQEFLDAYVPNLSHYLPTELRAELHVCGRVVQVDEQASPPAGTFARRIAHRLLIDLSWNSSRLEGNTYSLLETDRLISAGEVAAGKDARDAQMILNHKAAIEYLIDEESDIGIDAYNLFNLHAMLADNLLPDLSAVGRLRTIAVGITQTTFKPLDIPQRLEACFRQVVEKAAAINDPFEQSFFLLVHLPYLQPFEDVNKRVSRLAANIPLIRNNLCPLSFVDVPRNAYIGGLLGVYELNRIEWLRDIFAWAYRRSCGRYSTVRQTLGEPDPVRLNYRQVVLDMVAAVVRERLDKGHAAARIHEDAGRLVMAADRARVIELIETELLNLHEGSIARFRLRPAEFRAWREIWQ